MIKPTPVDVDTGVHVNSAVATALVVGIPSVLVALFCYWLSVRARHEMADSSRVQIDADAYTRARELYESAIAGLRQQIDDLRVEISRLRDEVAELRRRRRVLHARRVSGPRRDCRSSADRTVRRAACGTCARSPRRRSGVEHVA